MSKQVNKALIGGFVVGALAIVVAAVLVLGSGKLLTERVRYVLFFKGSVNGLNVGSPVQFKGVKIGEVQDIKLLMDPIKLTFVNQVVIEITPGTISQIGGDRNASKWTPEEDLELAKILVRRGMRAKLEMMSFVTGMMRVSFDFYPDTPVRLTGIETPYFELPTLPSDMEVIAEKLENIPFSKLVNEALEAVAGIKQLVRSPKIAKAFDNLNVALEDIQSLVRNVDRQVPPLASEMTATFRDARKLVNRIDQQVDPIAVELKTTVQTATTALEQAKSALENYETFIDEDAAFQYNLSQTLTQVTAAAESIRRLTDYLEQHPEALIRGKSGGN